MGIQRTRSNVPWTPSAWADGAIQTSNVPGSTVGSQVPEIGARTKSSTSVAAAMTAGGSPRLARVSTVDPEALRRLVELTRAVMLDNVAKSPADGYTLLLGSNSTFSIAPHLYKNLPYDNDNAFAPISLVATAHHMLAVGTHVPATTVAELVALARSKPGAINYGSTGPASIQRLQMEYFMALTGTQFTHVPFKGANETTMAMLANQMDATITASSNVLPHLPAGKLRALAITTVDFGT